MRRLLLLIALVPLTACHHTQVVSRDAVEDLQSAAEDQLGCDDVQVRQLTLLTRLVEGCGQQRVYAWDPQREDWVLESVERPLASAAR